MERKHWPYCISIRTAIRHTARSIVSIGIGWRSVTKNMMHTFRLLRMAREIALEGKVHVRRSDREYLLKIKQGVFEYEELVAKAEQEKNALTQLFKESDLPVEPDVVLVERMLEKYKNEITLNRIAGYIKFVIAAILLYFCCVCKTEYANE